MHESVFLSFFVSLFVSFLSTGPKRHTKHPMRTNDGRFLFFTFRQLLGFAMLTFAVRELDINFQAKKSTIFLSST